MKTRTLLMLCALTTPALADSGPDEDHDLIAVMGQLQTYSHKLDLAIGERNVELAGFYAHEVEEALESAEAIEQYHDQPIGTLVASMQVPAFERLEQALDAEAPDWATVDAAVDGYVASCNACHQATGYGMLRIERTDHNPYMQSFAPEQP